MIITTGLNKLSAKLHSMNSIKRIKGTSDFSKIEVLYSKLSLILTHYLAITHHPSSIMKTHKYSITLD